MKLVERCYDLKHADGYQGQWCVTTLVQETLDVDVPVAKQFFIDTMANLAQPLGNTTLQMLK